MNRSDRHRARLAVLVSLVAVPALAWASSRDATSDAADLGGQGSAPSTSTYVPEPPVFVDTREPAAPPAVVGIVVPAPPIGEEVDAVASFRRIGNADARPCATSLAPVNIVITVVNVDNGTSLQCRNVGSIGLTPGVDILLHTDIFSEIGDLTDAPIPTRLTW
jgi:hypothetical protein